MKSNISYYRHETGSHNHWKFKTLRREYHRKFGADGWAGEGKFWALNNIIADAEDCRLDLSDTDKRRSIAIDLDFSLEEFAEFVNLLVQVCKLVNQENDSLITGITQECYAEVSQKREYQRSWKKDKSKNKTGVSISKEEKSNIENEQTKVNETKVNETNDKVEGKEWNTKPSEAEMGLPLRPVTRGAVIQLFLITKNVKATESQVDQLWQVFKAQNFTGEKFYASDNQVYSHFINWCKTQDLKQVNGSADSNTGMTLREQKAKEILNG